MISFSTGHMPLNAEAARGRQMSGCISPANNASSANSAAIKLRNWLTLSFIFTESRWSRPGPEALAKVISRGLEI